MSRHRKSKIIRSPEKSDSRIKRLFAGDDAGALSDEAVFEELEQLRIEGSMDDFDSATKAHPGKVTTLVPLMNAAADFSLHAMRLDTAETCARIRVNKEMALLFETEIQSVQIAIKRKGWDWRADKADLVALDNARWALLLGREEEAAKLVSSVRSRRPRWRPALDARAEIAWDSCRFDEAEQALRSLLGLDPKSSSGAIGMARFLILHDRNREAAPYTDRLLDPTVFYDDPILAAELLVMSGRAAEANSRLGSSIRMAIDADRAPPYIIHLAAVFALAAGDEAGARKLWESIEHDAGTECFRESNLRDLRSPTGERAGPFALRLVDIIPLSCRMAVIDRAITSGLEGEWATDRLVGAIRTRCPLLMRGLAKAVFAFGDENAIAVFIERLAAPWFPELDEFLRLECESPAIPKARCVLLRGILARTAIGSNGAARGIPKNPGAWDISWDAANIEHGAEALNDETIAFLQSGDYAEAERALREYVRLYPDGVSQLNNLRFALNKQGKTAEVDEIGQKIRKLFPGYIRMQIEIAGELRKEEGDERAHRILDGILARRYIHGDELRAAVEARIGYYLNEKEAVLAAKWFDLWEEFEINEEKLLQYRPLMLIPVLQNLMEGSKVRAEKGRIRKEAREAAKTKLDAPPPSGRPEKSPSVGRSGKPPSGGRPKKELSDDGSQPSLF